MRYVNRRRLLIVVVLAALFGAALPYLEWAIAWALPDRLSQKPDAAALNPIEYSYFKEFPPGIMTRQTSYLFSDHIIVYGFGGTDSQWNDVKRVTGHLVDESMVSSRRGVILQRVGWPFRAAYMLSECDRGGEYEFAWNTQVRTPKSLTAFGLLPPLWPRSVLLFGAIGNVCLSVLLLGGSWWAAGNAKESWRKRYRTKRGKCFKCGYQSNGAAVCPECGAGAKA